MPEISGSFTGRVRVLNVLSLSDIPDHELQTVEIAGSHTSTDEIWNGAHFTYWGVSDLVAGNGTQRDSYLTEHADGGRDWGTFESKVASTRGETTLEGTWQSSDGTGRFAGIKGQGTFKTRLTSPMEVQSTWHGRYELAASAQAA